MSELQTTTVSEVANSNNAASPNGMAEGCAPSTVNDTWRENVAAQVRWFNRMHGLDNSRALLSSGGSAATHTLTFTTAPATLFTGMIVSYKAGANHDADSTLNINTLGAKNIQKMNAGGHANIVAGDIIADQHVVLKYDGTLDKFLMLSPSGSPTALTANNTWTGTNTFSGAVAMTNDLTLDDWQTIASATTTDIGAATSNFVAISGTATITGLGTDAAGTWRVLRATGAWTIAYSATVVGPQGQTTGTYIMAAGNMFVAISQGGGTWNLGALFNTIASAATVETGTDNTLAVTAGRLGRHPGVAKAWCFVTVSGGTPTLAASHNVASITDRGAGKYTVVFTTAFSSADYGYSMTCSQNVGTSVRFVGKDEDVTTLAGEFPVIVINSAGTAVDPAEWSATFFGDQA